MKTLNSRNSSCCTLKPVAGHGGARVGAHVEGAGGACREGSSAATHAATKAVAVPNGQWVPMEENLREDMTTALVIEAFLALFLHACTTGAVTLQL